MSKLHSNFFVGLRYTNKKGKTHKIEKVEKTYIKGRRGVKFYYGTTHYDEYEYDEDYNKDIEKDKILQSLNKELQENNKKLSNLLRALENGVFNDTTNARMKELENNNKELQEKISIRQLTVIKPLDENLVYDFLCSFKDIDETNTLAKQRMIDLFVNRAQLFDDGTMTIYYNATGDKGKQLKISDTPDVSKEIEYIESKKK